MGADVVDEDLIEEDLVPPEDDGPEDEEAEELHASVVVGNRPAQLELGSRPPDRRRSWNNGTSDAQRRLTDSGPDQKRTEESLRSQRQHDRLMQHWEDSDDPLLRGLLDALKRLESIADELPGDVVKALGGGGALMEALAKRMAPTMTLRARLKLLAWGACVASVLFVGGVVVGRQMDIGAYRERYMVRALSLPHAAAVLRSTNREEILDLISRNDSSTLRALARCSSDFGLRIVKSYGGSAVCAGVGAQRGFYPVP